MLNTAEIITGEAAGTAAFLGIAIGYPWLWLHYASTGVLKLAKAQQRTGASSAPPSGRESGEGGAAPISLNVQRGPDGKFRRRAA